MNRIFVILMTCLTVSCHTSKKVVYLQDVMDAAIEEVNVYQGVKIQPNDRVSIIVSSRNPELAQSFNLPLLSVIGSSTSSVSNYSSRVLGYLVDVNGYIDFPILGKVEVKGLTLNQLSDIIKQRLISEDLIKDPIITAEIMNFKISVLGEVRSPGIFNLQDDRITILEALARAGDLTIYGRRDNVLVTRREQNDMINLYRVDLRSANLIHSPVFYLQQNDVVYVSPNNTIAANSRINQNRTLGAAISFANFLTNVTLLIIKW